MRRARDDVTDTELAMLQVLWAQGEATRRQVADVLYPGGDAAHYATVQKLLERLEAKGCVKHVRRRGVLVFRATVGRDELLHRRLLDMAEKFCAGALAPVVMNLVRSKPLSAAELDELQAFIEEQRRQGGPGGEQR